MEKYLIYPKDNQVEGYNPGTGERTLEDTKEDVERILRQKEYMGNVLYNESFKPMSQEEIETVKEEIKKIIRSVHWRLEKDGIFYDDSFQAINGKVIFNHLYLIKDALEKESYSHSLDWAKITRNGIKRFAVYDGKRISRDKARKKMEEHLDEMQK